jgi:peptide/nickel transport system permease protein
MADRHTRAGRQRARYVASLAAGRVATAAATLFVVSVLVFWATQVLPGDAAYAVLGHNASPEQIRAMQQELGLDQSIPQQYWHWASGLLTGDLGTSLADHTPVWDVVRPRLVNTAVLTFLAGVIGSTVGVLVGIVLAARKDGRLDNVVSSLALAVTALPEFVVAVALVIVFSTVVWHVLPGVSVLPPGTYPWQQPQLLVLPVAALVIIVVPYITRMTRATMIEALDSDYCEMARLKGASPARLLFVHALPNALPPIIQVIALTLLYLAGGIVVVENAFAFPGIGQGLVNAVGARDIPVIQAIVVGLGAFYLVVNIGADAVVVLLSPRRREAV